MVDPRGLGDQCRVRAGYRRRVGPLHPVGATLLVRHRRVLHRCAQCAGVGHAGGPAGIGDRRGPHRGVAQLLQQRPVLGSSDGVPGGRRAQCRATQFRSARLLGRDRDLRDPGDDPRRQAGLRHLPDPALRHPLANLVDSSPHRGLACRPGVLPGPVRAGGHRESRSAHPTGHRRADRRRRHRTQRSDVLLAEHVALRCGQRVGVRGVLHGHPVEAVGPAGGARARDPQGPVLDRPRIRRDRVGGRVLDRVTL